MRSKINEMKYAQLADMEKDFKLIIDNCLKFNRNNLYYLDYAKDYRKQVNIYFFKKKIFGLKNKKKVIINIHSVSIPRTKILFKR